METLMHTERRRGIKSVRMNTFPVNNFFRGALQEPAISPKPRWLPGVFSPMKPLRLCLVASGCCVAALFGGVAPKSVPTAAEALLARATEAADYTAFQAAFAELQDKFPEAAVGHLPIKFAQEIKFGEAADAERTLAVLIERARARQRANDLVDAVYYGIRRSIPPVCSTSAFAARKQMVAEFVRNRAAFVPLITRAAETAVEIAPDSGTSLTARADAALLAGDYHLAADCTKRTISGLTHPGARANTQRYLEELEKEAAKAVKVWKN